VQGVCAHREADDIDAIAVENAVVIHKHALGKVRVRIAMDFDMESSQVSVPFTRKTLTSLSA